MKTFKQWLVKKLLKLSKTLDVEKAIRDAFHRGCEITEKKYAEHSYVWYDPTVRSYPQKPVQKIDNPHGRYFLSHRPRLLPVEKPAAPTTINEMSPEQIAEVPTIHDLTEDAWLNSGNDPTLSMPAIVKALHQGRNAG